MDHFPIVCETIPEDMRLRLKNELNETEENVRQGLHSMREYIEREKIPSRTDDAFLLCFLRAQKFNIQKSKERLRRYCHMRQKQLAFFEDIDMDKMRAALDSQVVGLLPYRDKQGRAIVFSRAYAWNKELYDVIDSTKCGVLLMLFALTYPLTTMAGLTFILDARVDSIQDYIPNFRAFSAHASTLLAVPGRFQLLDIVNENSMCHYFYAAIRPLLPTKFKNRVRMHGNNIAQLQDYYDPSILPHEFGGTMGPLSNESYRDTFLDFVSGIKSECAYFRSS